MKSNTSKCHTHRYMALIVSLAAVLHSVASSSIQSSSSYISNSASGAYIPLHAQNKLSQQYAYDQTKGKNGPQQADTYYNLVPQQAQQSNQQQQAGPTTLPPAITTTSHNLQFAESMQSTQQHQAANQHHRHPEAPNQPTGEQRSVNNANEEHDDGVPLATINNHSRNNQHHMKPPQYVDVSALVGRERQTNGNNNHNTTASNSISGSMSNSAGMTSTASSTAFANHTSAGLSAKSRSGLPECATQQVCNAIFVRMNYTQKLCECSSNYNWKCSNNLDPQDGHTIELTRKFDKRIYTQIKTCEPLGAVRACKAPTDWTLLALQSERSGKAHYVVVCKCPTWAQLEGPYTHNHPPYANIPGE